MKFLTVLLVVILATFLFVGCIPVVPDVPEPVGECVAGYYVIYYAEWTDTGCPNDPIQPAGTYWRSCVDDECELFYVGVAVPVEDVFDVYGECPIVM